MNGDKTIRRLTAAAVLLVAAIAAVVSLHPHRAPGRDARADAAAAWLLPVSVDGTVAAASLSMLWAARSGLPAPWLARCMLTLGVLATLAANVGYGAPYGVSGELLSGWPAVAFVGSVEMVLAMIRRARTAPARPCTPLRSATGTACPTAAGNGGTVRRRTGRRRRPRASGRSAARSWARLGHSRCSRICQRSPAPD